MDIPVFTIRFEISDPTGNQYTDRNFWVFSIFCGIWSKFFQIQSKSFKISKIMVRKVPKITKLNFGPTEITEIEIVNPGIYTAKEAWEVGSQK